LEVEGSGGLLISDEVDEVRYYLISAQNGNGLSFAQGGESREQLGEQIVIVIVVVVVVVEVVVVAVVTPTPPPNQKSKSNIKDSTTPTPGKVNELSLSAKRRFSKARTVSLAELGVGATRAEMGVVLGA